MGAELFPVDLAAIPADSFYMAARKDSRAKTKASASREKASNGMDKGAPETLHLPSAHSVVIPGQEYERSRRRLAAAAVAGILIVILLLLWKFCGPDLSWRETPAPETSVSKEPEKPKKEEKPPVVKPKPPVVKKDEPRVIRDEDFKPEPIRSQMALTYTIQKGDSLEKIAASALGSKGRWKEIRDANRLKNVGPRDLLPPNRDIVIPVQ